jgi:hypothetical protein
MNTDPSVDARPPLFARPSMMPPARRNAPHESKAAARSMVGPAAAQRVACSARSSTRAMPG